MLRPYSVLSNRDSDLGKSVHKQFGFFVEKGAKIGKNVMISLNASILSGSIIGDNSLIGSHCIIGHPSKLHVQKTDFSATSPKVADFVIKRPTTRIGEGSVIRSGSVIYTHVRIGKKLRTGHSILIRENVAVGDNCVIGTHAILDGYSRLGNNSMIQSQCYITQSVSIGNYVFIAPGCIFLDNKRIILGEGLERISIDDYVRIGGGTKILAGATIGKHALIGAGSVVTKSIPPKAVAYGIPAKVKGFQSDKDIERYVDSVKGWQ